MVFGVCEWLAFRLCFMVGIKFRWRVRFLGLDETVEGF